MVDTYSSELDSAISYVVCRWPNLQELICPNVTLSMDAISHLSSVSNLKRLAFETKMGIIQDISHLDSVLVFSNLTNLNIRSGPINTIIPLLHCIRLPAIETICVSTSGYISRRAIQACCAAVREACPSNGLTCFQLCGEKEEDGVPPDDEALVCITLKDLHPCTAFAELRELYVNFDCPVSLTDADLLELVSPRMESFVINERGWQIAVDGGGITLSGLVQLLRRCPSLSYLCLAIDTRTFTEIPEGLDVSFPPQRQLNINLLDSYILPDFVPSLVSVFRAFGQDSSMPVVWEMGRWTVGGEEFRTLWERVLDEL